ncbi:hypothetical protein Nepgr_014813 [Nepenthes gracilis]|uniref:Uncharacterized protein n=1 Tax=Nepenthes gracilis TaxID=150966 RepID=A0AAD3XPU8_NEPGR|nr:hypothetical protein Nepgr_014813 [Nepenthes gracilis]
MCFYPVVPAAVTIVLQLLISSFDYFCIFSLLDLLAGFNSDLGLAWRWGFTQLIYWLWGMVTILGAGLAATCAQFFGGCVLGSSSSSTIRSREGFCYGVGDALLR